MTISLINSYSHFIGSKNDIDLYENLIKEHLPNHSNYTYIEPFGGSFGLVKVMDEKPNYTIYNDKFIHDVELVMVDEIHHKDYTLILDEFDDTNSVFYLDPPYYGKEHVYNLKRYDNLFHIKLSEEVKNRKGKILISYEDNPFIRQLYSECDIYSYKGNNPRKEREILIVING